jgi:hypothetical protein
MASILSHDGRLGRFVRVIENGEPSAATLVGNYAHASPREDGAQAYHCSIGVANFVVALSTFEMIKTGILSWGHLQKSISISNPVHPG